MEKVKIVVFVPESHADAVRKAMGEAGAGQIGNYSQCSFTTKGYGRFLPGVGAHPTIGQVGQVEVVPEERIEMVCNLDMAPNVLEAMKGMHPYEEVAYDVYKLLDL